MAVDISQLWESRCRSAMEQINQLPIESGRSVAKGQLNVLVGYFTALIDTKQIDYDAAKRYVNTANVLYRVIDFRYDVLEECDTPHLREVLLRINRSSDITDIVSRCADIERFKTCCLGYYVADKSIKELQMTNPRITVDYKKHCCQEIAKYLLCVNDINAVNNIVDLYGIRRSTATALAKAGIYTSDQVNNSSDEKLLSLPGIGQDSLHQLRKRLRCKYYANPEPSYIARPTENFG